MREKEQGLKKDQGCKDRPNIETEENRTTKRFKKVKGEFGLPPKPESGFLSAKGLKSVKIEPGLPQHASRGPLYVTTRRLSRLICPQQKKK